MFLRCITQDMAAILNSNAIACLPKDVYLAGGKIQIQFQGNKKQDHKKHTCHEPE